MANNSVTNEPSVQPSTPFVSDRIFPGAAFPFQEGRFL